MEKPKKRIKFEGKPEGATAGIRKIIIELDKHLEVRCEGMTNLMEILGLLKLAEDEMLQYQREKSSTLEMIEN